MVFVVAAVGLAVSFDNFADSEEGIAVFGALVA